MRIILILLVLQTHVLSHAQNLSAQTRNLELAFDSLQIDSLKAIYEINKKIPSNFADQIYIALSYFPELASTKIVFKEARIKTTLNARPTPLSLIFRSKKKRKYVVRMNTSKKDSLVLLENVPFNAMIGLFGHEFCHFIDYNSKNLFGIISRLFAYSSKKSKEKFEKEIDAMTIEKGLGWQLYDWSYYVLYASNGTVKYKKYKERIYLEPHEIEKKIINATKNNLQ